MIPKKQSQLEYEFIPGQHDQALGFGSLRVSLTTSSIWCDSDGRGIPWTWIDLLEQLASSWPFIRYEESAPEGVYDSTLRLLRQGRLAATDFDFEPATQNSKDIYIFLRRHNLATGITGLFLPSFSLLREGQKIWVASANVAKLLDLNPTLHTLEQLGNDLAANIAAAPQQERSRLAIEAWKSREPDLSGSLQIKLGATRITEIVPPGQSVVAYFEAQNDDQYESSLLVAARMSEALPLKVRKLILDSLRVRPGTGATSALIEASAEAQAQLPSYMSLPHEQGATLAQWARKKFGIAPHVKADPQDVLTRLGVEVSTHNFGIDVIDAVGCWGNRHGPAVLVNQVGRHAQSSAGRRATLAHELAHVLIDRNGSLPAAEVFGGNVPRYPEQRANAFAAEFLLPKSVAITRIQQASGDAIAAIEELLEQFAVSRELAAWQIRNSHAYASLNNDEKQELRSWTASDRTWFFRE
ncbi:MAG: ImmA/IrrE family metallo-endopeptidase [Steroidobacteraceae bacterium]